VCFVVWPVACLIGNVVVLVVVAGVAVAGVVGVAAGGVECVGGVLLGLSSVLLLASLFGVGGGVGVVGVAAAGVVVAGVGGGVVVWWCRWWCRCWSVA